MSQIKSSKNKLKPVNWEWFGFWNISLFFSSVFFESKNSKIYKDLNLDLKFDMLCLKNNYYLLKENLQKLRSLAIKSIKSKNDYLNKMFLICDKVTESFSRLENKNDLKAFILKLKENAALSMIVEETSFIIDSYYQEVCKNQGKTFEEFTSLLKPYKNTPLMKYFNDLNKLEKKDHSIFIKKYKWVGTHGFEGEEYSQNKLNEELDRIKSIKTLKEFKDIPREFNSIYEVASKFIYYRSHIMETINKICYSYKHHFIELGKKYGLTFDEILSLTWYEFINLIDTGILPPNVKTRKKEFGVIYLNSNYNLVFNEDLKILIKKFEVKIDKNIKKLKGQIAYKGVIKGHAKILMKPEDISKVNKGDIIIASETTVDYVIGMGRAGAFVTNQGGITSHAAILSRELGKPCIIGTKIATKVFKDGDLVEVDANKGVVKKIK